LLLLVAVLLLPPCRSNLWRVAMAAAMRRLGHLHAVPGQDDA